MSKDESKEELLARVAELESQVRGLEKDLIHDALTGLKTRAFFEEESKTYFEVIANKETGKRKEWFGFTNISFLFLDIDHFKQINDTYGHDVGDIVLKKVAENIERALREGDTAARWGGEEILVTLLGAGEEDGFYTALRINEIVKNLRFPEAPDLKVTISCGVAALEKGISFEELVKRADEALYKAKNSGRNTVVRYSELTQ